MVDFDYELMNAKNQEDLKKLKVWMFQEQVKIQAKADELLEVSRELLEEKKTLERERKELDIKIKAENKRSRDNEVLMAKKLKMIEEAYQQMALEKKALECERLNLEYEREKLRRMKASNQNVKERRTTTNVYEGIVFFNGVDNQLALRKRYKELLKIFHPDNRCGDTDTLQRIQSEYDSMRKKYYEV